MSRLDLHDRTVDLARRVVEWNGASQALTPNETDLLSYMATHRGRALSRDELITQVWGYDAAVVSRAMDLTVLRLRTKIEANPKKPRHLLSVRGVGYRFELDTAPVGAELSRVAELLSSFVGRESELAEANVRLSEARILTVCGPGGVGKSRLARRVATQWPATSRLCSMAESRTEAHVIAVLAEAFEVGASTPEALVEALAADNGTLMVVDECDRAVEAVGRVLAKVASAGRTRFLLTSRQPLEMEGEALLRLEPPDRDQAIRFFRVRSSELGVEPGDAALVGELVDKLDRLPLALEFAVARLDVLSVRQILDHLGLDLLSAADGGSIRGMLEWSWKLLSVPEQKALAALTVFRGGAARPELEATLGELVGSVDGLVRRSLVGLHGGRYGLLSLVEAFLVGRRPEVLDDEAIGALELRHAQAYARTEVTRRPTPEVANLERALEHAWSCGDPALASALSLRLVRTRLARFPVGPIAELTERTLEMDLVPRDRLTMLTQAANLQMMGRQTTRARVHYEEAMVLARELGDVELVYNADWGLAVLDLNAGDLDAATERLERGLGDQVNAPAHRARLRRNLGTVYRALGRVEDMRRMYLESGALLVEPEPYQHVALAVLAACDGDYEAGIEQAETAVAIARDLSDVRAEAEALSELGALHLHLGQFEAARPILAQSVTFWSRIGDPKGESMTRAHWAHCLAACGDEGWRREARKAERTVEAKGDPFSRSIVALRHALAVRIGGRPEELEAARARALATSEAGKVDPVVRRLRALVESSVTPR